MAAPVLNRFSLNADAMSLASYVFGQSTVGIRLSGSWVGTVKFYGSYDGVRFTPLTVTPFASGTDVVSATANGNWYVPVQNYVVVKAVFTRTSGTVNVTIAAAQDTSYQEAFIAPASQYVTSTSASATTNTLTVSGQANRAWKLKTLNVTTNAQPAWLTSPNLQIKDGTTVLWQMDLPPQGSSGIIYPITLPDEGITVSPGADLVIVVPSAGTGKFTTINAEVIPG